MNKIKTLNAKRLVAVFTAMLIAVLSLSYTGNKTEATNGVRKYYVYDAKTAEKLDAYSLSPLPYSLNSRSVIGTDERVIDWSKSGVVKIMNSHDFIGNGFVVSDHVIATAAHCLFSISKGPFKISEILLFDNNGKVTLHATPVEYHFPEEFAKDTNNEMYDYGLISVKEDLSAYACFELGSVLPSFADSNPAITVAGFPKDKKDSMGNLTNTHTRHTMYSGDGVVSEINYYDSMFYSADTADGNSGGPVYLTESLNGETYYTVVAIHAYQSHKKGDIDHSAGNHGLCITTDLINFYKANQCIYWE